MGHEDNKPAEHRHGAAMSLQPQDLCEVERYFIEKGASDFLYDAKLDIFRFREDGRFAFCEEFADWTLLEERGYLDF
jgi:hypothetical protein